MKIDESCVARRRFLCSMLGGGVAAMGDGAVVPLLQVCPATCTTPPPDFLALEKAECELPPGKAKMILYGRIPALLLRPADGDGAIKVFVATCTHLNCTVAYQSRQESHLLQPATTEFTAPTARVLSGPPPRPLRPVLHQGGGPKS